MESDSIKAYIQNLKTRILSLEQLLDVYESAALEQTEKLRQEISERRETEKQALIFKRFSEASGQSFGMAALDGAVIYMNPTLCRLLGERDPKDVLGKKVFQYYPETLRERMQKEIIPSVMETGQWIGELCLLNGRGGCTPTIENIFLIRDDDETPLCMANVITDIGERKQAEEALRESEQKFRTLFEKSAYGILVVDLETMRFSYANPSICRMLGYSETELLELSVKDIHPKESLDQVMSDFELQMQGVKPMATFPCLRKDGTVFHAAVNSVRIIIKGRECVMGFFADVTERKQAEEALRESEERYHLLFEEAKDGIAFGDVKTGEIEDCNKALCLLTERDKTELVGQPQGILHPPHQLKNGHSSSFRLHKAGDPGQILEDNLLSKSGKMIPVEIRASRIRMNGRDYILGIFRDITVRKQAVEEVNRLNEKLEQIVEQRTRQLCEAQEALVRKEKLSILGRLAGSVGHELRNPLGVMNNAVYFLEMVLSDADETVKEYLGIIKHEIDHSQRIITDLLDFARTRTPQRKSATVGGLIAESLGRCAVAQNVSVRIEIPEALPAVRVDPLQMGQVFENLIMNAVQAMPEGGALTIRAAQERNALKICVIDTGEGISEENMKNLFQPLFTTKAKGIGLGLVVCRNLTEANGGRIEAESRSGEGATFTVILPVEGSET